MIQRVGSTPHPIDEYNGLRSFQDAGKSGSVFRQALMAELDNNTPEAASKQPTTPRQEATSLPTQNPPQPVRPKIQPQYQPQLQPMIDEVHQIAQSSGYVGVTSQDILRAYQTGRSFLADYKV